MAHTDYKDDTLELLKEADMQNPKLEMEQEDPFFVSFPEKGSAHKPNLENITRVQENMDNKKDTVNPPKGTPMRHSTLEIQVSSVSHLDFPLLLSYQVVS